MGCMVLETFRNENQQNHFFGCVKSTSTLSSTNSKAAVIVIDFALTKPRPLHHKQGLRKEPRYWSEVSQPLKVWKWVKHIKYKRICGINDQLLFLRDRPALNESTWTVILNLLQQCQHYYSSQISFKILPLRLAWISAIYSSRKLLREIYKSTNCYAVQ